MTTFQGNVLKYDIIGASHAAEISVKVSGLPSGITVDMEQLAAFLKRRAPGNNKWSTPRKEADLPLFRSGIEQNVTTGDLLEAAILNTNTRSGDYELDIPRPAHADYTAWVKYHGNLNMAGGGPFSGRMTAPLCILGGICLQYLASKGIQVGARIVQIGSIHGMGFDPLSSQSLINDTEFPAADRETAERMIAEIEKARMDLDSVGGIVECCVLGLPAGIGGPMTDGIESTIAAIMFGVPAVKGIEFGEGFHSAYLRGSENNDAFTIDGGIIKTATNHHGGILGGISSGMPLLFRTAFKPTPSIGKEQDSISLSRMEPAKLVVHGRHDPCIVPRAVPVVEAVAAIAITDLILAEEKNNGLE